MIFGGDSSRSREWRFLGWEVLGEYETLTWKETAKDGQSKSQLAIEYAYRTQEQSPSTWVFWVHASNAARFEQSFREIADRVKIPSRNDPTTNILQLVHGWLCDERKGRWFLILDNVDDATFLVEDNSSATWVGQASGVGNRNSQPLVTYLPNCRQGTILVTSRSNRAAGELVEQRNIISVGPMDHADARELLKKKLGRYDGSNTSPDLVTALECMPLAIVQAAAYINQRVPRYSEDRYLEDFQKNERKRTSLLNHADERLCRDREAKSSIIITWQISFDHIREIRPSAADLLSLMSYFDRQGIPETLLRHNEDLLEMRQSPNNSVDDKRAHIISDNNETTIMMIAPMRTLSQL